MNDYGKMVEQKSEYKARKLGRTMILMATGFGSFTLANLLRPSIGFLWFVGLAIIIMFAIIALLSVSKTQKYTGIVVSASWLVTLPVNLHGDFNFWANIGIGFFLFILTLSTFQEWLKFSGGKL
ncbi:hypothetical protein [Paenibacillus sp. ACRRY]|uniref:hypothetical protein n=1 Tax=Paenibacillus sp. ACRRY TaxID=2918208 RepID=UPI001EF4B023|nr:hypothetical protein [Paenibacillus sp. ACRRY]MCG7385108.1 hypothetical protein [Paenibacillus sp. ACRRY]